MSDHNQSDLLKSSWLIKCQFFNWYSLHTRLQHKVDNESNRREKQCDKLNYFLSIECVQAFGFKKQNEKEYLWHKSGIPKPLNCKNMPLFDVKTS